MTDRTVTEYFAVELFVPELGRWWWSGTRYDSGGEALGMSGKAKRASRVVKVTETREVIGAGVCRAAAGSE